VLTDLRFADVPMHRTRSFVFIALFATAFLIALPLDIPLSTLAHTSGLAPWLKNQWLLTHIIRFPGNFFFTLAVCGIMVLIEWAGNHRHGGKLIRSAMIVLFSGILAGLNAPLKFMFGRIRPYHGVPAFEFHPFRTDLLSTEAGFSFPSGDASLAFAMAMSLTLTLPRQWPLWWTLAVIVAVERVAENAHYPSDVVAGAALGVGVAFFARWVVTAVTKK
jgi:membrane-associated phospholipid phosphatase